MKKIILLIAVLLTSCLVHAQVDLEYISHLKSFRTKYVSTHEVVKAKDRKFMRFFNPDISYNISADFEKIIDTTGFLMLTSSGKSSRYFVYGKVKFLLGNKLYSLRVYQSLKLMNTKKFADYIFIPFTDLTTGLESYGAGRYIDLFIKDIRNNKLDLDFNKAYNPYCAYDTGFNCPIPPRQNFLNIPVKAGERSYGKRTH